jgi:monoamine oxidase
MSPASGRAPHRSPDPLAGHGGPHRRAVLAAPVDALLFFAGEATAPVPFTTARAVNESRLPAADAELAALPPAR